MIVAIFVAGPDAEDPLADPFVQALTGQSRVSEIVQAGDESFGQADLVIELLDGWNACVAADLNVLGFDDHGETGDETEAKLTDTLLNYQRPPCHELRCFATTA